MAPSKLVDFLVSAVLLISLLSMCPSSSAQNKNLKDIPKPVEVDDFKDCFQKVFAFGDSSIDTGNGFILGTVKAEVKQFLVKSAPTLSSGETGLQGHRLSNGRLVIDYVCEALGKPTLPPYKGVSADFSNGVNFAVAGATALSSNFFNSGKYNISSLIFSSVPPSYATQIDWFNKYVNETECQGKTPEACKETIGSALFWMGPFGSNDYARIIDSNRIVSKNVIKVCVDHVKQLITSVMEKGAKFVVVEGLTPTGCQSLELSLCDPSDHDEVGCSITANEWIKGHNDLLQKAIDELRANFSDAIIVYADAYSAYQSILTNHKVYEIVEPFKACCGAGDGELHFEVAQLCGLPGSSTCKDASKYMNWDGIHLTEAMNRNLADVLFNKGQCKPNFSELIAKKKASVAQAKSN